MGHIQSTLTLTTADELKKRSVRKFVVLGQFTHLRGAAFKAVPGCRRPAGRGLDRLDLSQSQPETPMRVARWKGEAGLPAWSSKVGAA